MLKTLLILFFILLCFPVYSESNSISGKVISVHDGDTFTAQLCDGLQIQVRLIGVDAPELKQTSGIKVKDYVSNLIINKNVMLMSDKKKYDTYGRFLMYVFIDDVFLNRLLLQKGFAVSAPYAPNIKFDDQFTKDVSEAKKNKTGLWLTNEFDITPKQFRHKK